MTSKRDRLMTIREVSEFCKVSRRTVLRWIENGQLKAFKIGAGRLWRIRERDLKRFIKGDSETRA